MFDKGFQTANPSTHVWRGNAGRMSGKPPFPEHSNGRNAAQSPHNDQRFTVLS